MSIIKQKLRVRSLASAAAHRRRSFSREHEKLIRAKDRAIGDPLVTASWSFAAGVWCTLPRRSSAPGPGRRIAAAVSTFRDAVATIQNVSRLTR
ncbi:MAG TPA: hypothetical protein VKQ06_10080, partial [Gammaproteobacteria bacterium]|nr:hypothetical protein [Gammaproteobacteria bacterium]